MRRTVSISLGLAFVAAFAAGPALGQPSSASYTFATTTSGTFTDMTSGTTQLVAAAQDDTASLLTNIGFDFYYMGTRFSQFSASSNGMIRLGGAVSTTQYTLGTAAIPLITAYGSDLFTSTTGKVHFKVTGAAPNRVLTVEFLKETIIYDAAGATTDGTYQVRLFETTGGIEFVYGGMNRNASTGFLGGMEVQYVGFSTNSTDNTYATVTTATNTVNTTVALAANQPPLSTPIANLNTPVDGSHRTYSFTPPTPAAPTALNFTGISPFAMTLNWTDSPNELFYAVYRSTDGVNYAFDGTALQNAVTYNAAGLNPNVTYFWQVYAVTEGAVSSALAGSQATSAGGSVSSTATGGPWSVPATWAGGTVPVNTDNVTIADGATVTIDTAAVALSVTVGTGGPAAVLVWDAAIARTLTVGNGVTIAGNGTFQSPASGAVTTHNLSVTGNLTNNGILDFSTNGNTAGAVITFTGAVNATFSGTGPTTDIRQITVNKGTTPASILELMPTNFTDQGVTTDVVGGWLTLTNGTLKLSGTFTGTNRVFTAAAYTVLGPVGFWLNNPSYTVAGQNGSPTIGGLLRITQGTFNVGTATGNSMGFSSGSTIVVEGGAVNATGRFGVAAAGNVINYTQSAGTITVCTIGNASGTLASFDLGTSLASTINMSGGTIVVQLPNTSATPFRDYRNQAGGGIAGVTGGTLQLGNAASGAAKAFIVVGVLPNLVITNTSGNHTATFSTVLASFNNISLNVTINTGNTINFGNVVFLFQGTTLTNNGTLTHNGASSNFVWFTTTAPVFYTGTGVVTMPMTNFAMQATQGLTLDPASPNITALAVRLFFGSIINSNKITLGNGGATTGTVQIGNTTTPTAAGTFDVPLTFNLGTGGQILAYLRTTASRSTGPEINPTRSVTSMTLDDNDVTHALPLAGGDLTVTGTTALTNGRLVTGANTEIVGPAGTVTRTNGYVDGNFRKTCAAAGTKTFEIGTANGFTPFVFNATGGTFPTDVTAKATQTTAPGIFPTNKAINRYWTLTASGVTADLTFNYLPLDVPGTVTEANLKLFRHDMAGFTDVMGTVNAVTHQATVTGINTFSDWTLAEFVATPPTAAVSGDSTICSGGMAMISAGLTGTAPWDITWSDGVPQLGVAMSPATRIVSPAMTTVYTVTTVSDANGAGTASGSATVTVNPDAAAPVVTAPADETVTQTLCQ